jgi:hypothetical protein
LESLVDFKIGFTLVIAREIPCHDHLVDSAYIQQKLDEPRKIDAARKSAILPVRTDSSKSNLAV